MRGVLFVVRRALRHGLVASGLCVLIALAVGVGGSLAGDHEPAPRAGAVRASSNTSMQVVGRWLKPVIADAAAAPRELLLQAQPAPGAPASAVAASAAVQEGVPEAARAQPVSVEVPPAPPAAAVVTQEQRVVSTTPDLREGDRPLVTVSFYYCEASRGFASGDGGGFCGRVRDGSFVRSGVAACDVAYLGQRFRIEGDPTGRTYVCADTGSAVHGMHRDIWFLDNRGGWGWQNTVGTTAVIEIVP